MSKAEYIWEVLNVLVPTRVTPEERNKQKQSKREQIHVVEELINKPISEVFPQK